MIFSPCILLSWCFPWQLKCLARIPHLNECCCLLLLKTRFALLYFSPWITMYTSFTLTCHLQIAPAECHLQNCLSLLFKLGMCSCIASLPAVHHFSLLSIFDNFILQTSLLIGPSRCVLTNQQLRAVEFIAFTADTFERRAVPQQQLFALRFEITRVLYCFVCLEPPHFDGLNSVFANLSFHFFPS